MRTDENRKLFGLSAPERLKLAEQLWESAAVEAEGAGLTSEEKKFIDAQLADYKANPDDTISWSSVKKPLGL